ncbi:MAG TPA: GNAT family N-acetyltransferase [Acidimicrobiales bacterium]|nr:GNAT family N-acetyltransferase [Acidimicrobiales bacterium]
MSQAAAPDGRVALYDLDLSTAADILAGRRQDDWSAGYPTDGDRDIARWLVDHPPPAGTDPLYLPKQIVDARRGLVVGGIGCHRPPDRDRRVEIGYGVAPEARNQGLTSEAVRLLVAGLRMAGVHTVVARTARDNPPSQAVLRHNGFVGVGVDPDGLLRWELRLRGSAHS